MLSNICYYLYIELKGVNTLVDDNLMEENISIYRDLEDVVSALKRLKEDNINVNLLIGAGCSVTANIPAKTRYGRYYKKNFLVSSNVQK